MSAQAKRQRRERVFFIVWLAVSVAAAAAIFSFSAQPAAESSELSHDFVEQVLTVLHGEKVSHEEVVQYTPIARKTAHFALYFALGLNLTGLMHHQHRLPKLPAAIGIGAVYAALDEFHQHFVPGRGPMLTDVLLDACGVAAGALLMTLLLWLLYRRKEP